MNNILTLIPVIFNVVKMIEQLMPASAGKEKFDAAIATLTQIYGDISGNMPAITSVVNGAVSLLNLAGIFTKKA